MLAALIFERGLDALGETIVEVGAADPNARLNILAANGSRLLATTWGDTLSILRRDDGVVLASEPYDDDPDWEDVPDRHLVEVTAERRHLDRPEPQSERTLMTLSLSNHLAADSAYHALRRDVLRGAAEDAEIVAAQMVLRLGGQRPVRPDHPAAGVLPDPCRGRDPACPRGGDRDRPAGPTPWSNWAAGRRRRPGCCWTRCATADRCAGSCPFDVDASMLSTAAAAIQREYPGVEINAVCGDFEEHLTEIPEWRATAVRVLGSTIGNLTPGAAGGVPRALAAVMRPGDSLLLGTRPGQGHRSAGAGLRRRRRSDGARSTAMCSR